MSKIKKIKEVKSKIKEIEKKKSGKEISELEEKIDFSEAFKFKRFLDDGELSSLEAVRSEARVVERSKVKEDDERPEVFSYNPTTKGGNYQSGGDGYKTANEYEIAEHVHGNLSEANDSPFVNRQGGDVSPGGNGIFIRNEQMNTEQRYTEKNDEFGNKKSKRWRG